MLCLSCGFDNFDTLTIKVVHFLSGAASSSRGQRTHAPPPQATMRRAYAPPPEATMQRTAHAPPPEPAIQRAVPLSEPHARVDELLSDEETPKVAKSAGNSFKKHGEFCSRLKHSILEVKLYFVSIHSKSFLLGQFNTDSTMRVGFYF